MILSGVNVPQSEPNVIFRTFRTFTFHINFSAFIAETQTLPSTDEKFVFFIVSLIRFRVREIANVPIAAEFSFFCFLILLSSPNCKKNPRKWPF